MLLLRLRTLHMFALLRHNDRGSWEDKSFVTFSDFYDLRVIGDRDISSAGADIVVEGQRNV